MNVFKAVQDFHEKFKVKWAPKPDTLPSYIYQYRLGFLNEELVEFVDAHNAGDIEGELDAIVDLIYVASGTLYLMGFSAEKQAEAFKRVHEANMKKKRAKNANESKRGHAFDVVKPVDWVAPDLSDLCR